MFENKKICRIFWCKLSFGFLGLFWIVWPEYEGTTFILNHCTPPSRGPRLCLALDNGGRAAFNIPVHKQVPQLWSRTKTRCLGFLFCPVQRYRAAPLAHRNLTDTSLSSSSSKERWCSISFVGFIVVACKFIGLAREIVTAARFGVGLVSFIFSFPETRILTVLSRWWILTATLHWFHLSFVTWSVRKTMIAFFGSSHAFVSCW